MECYWALLGGVTIPFTMPSTPAIGTPSLPSAASSSSPTPPSSTPAPFVPCKPASRHRHLPDNIGAVASSLSLRYTIPELLPLLRHRRAAAGGETAVLRLLPHGHLVVFYANLTGGDRYHPTTRHWSCVDVRLATRVLAGDLDATARALSNSDDAGGFSIWNDLAGGLARRLFADMCWKNGDLLPPRFTSLPADLLSKILSRLADKDLAKVECTCSELRDLVAGRELRKDTYIAAATRWRWWQRSNRHFDFVHGLDDDVCWRLEELYRFLPLPVVHPVYFDRPHRQQDQDSSPTKHLTESALQIRSKFPAGGDGGRKQQVTAARRRRQQRHHPLHDAIDAGDWDAEPPLGRLVVLAHAAFLHSGLVPFATGGKPASRHHHLPDRVDDEGIAGMRDLIIGCDILMNKYQTELFWLGMGCDWRSLDWLLVSSSSRRRRRGDSCSRWRNLTKHVRMSERFMEKRSELLVTAEWRRHGKGAPSSRSVCVCVKGNQHHPLHDAIDAGDWDAEPLLGRLVVLAHAAFLHAGLVPSATGGGGAGGARPGSRHHHLPEHLGAVASSLSLRYTIPELLPRKRCGALSGAAETAVLRFSPHGDHLVVFYGNLAGGNAENPKTRHWSCVDARLAARVLAGDLDAAAHALSNSGGGGVSLWNDLAGGLARRVFADMCWENGDLLPPRLTLLPASLQENILRSLTDVEDMARVYFTCKGIRNLIDGCHVMKNRYLWGELSMSWLRIFSPPKEIVRSRLAGDGGDSCSRWADMTKQMTMRERFLEKRGKIPASYGGGGWPVVRHEASGGGVAKARVEAKDTRLRSKKAIIKKRKRPPHDVFTTRTYY
uniref:F-box domain-containing protein n=1 Tax=Leersia perrieri TaxID=77586 RepID=A0A0D9XHK0_9ORYZ